MRCRETPLSLMNATSSLEISQARKQHLQCLAFGKKPTLCSFPSVSQTKIAFCSDMTKIYSIVTYIYKRLTLAGLAQ